MFFHPFYCEEDRLSTTWQTPCAFPICLVLGIIHHLSSAAKPGCAKGDAMPPINPLNLAKAEAALLLSKASGKTVTEDMIREAIEAGCPTDASGNLNLVHVAAWLNRELHRPPSA
jgi:hypothetical protein